MAITVVTVLMILASFVLFGLIFRFIIIPFDMFVISVKWFFESFLYGNKK